MIEPLKNCPNCGGYLNDIGRCVFCGSKVYDFVNIDFNKHAKTYIRIRDKDKIITAPVVFNFGSLQIDYPTTMLNNANNYCRAFVDTPIMTGSIDYTVVGDIITEMEDTDDR